MNNALIPGIALDWNTVAMSGEHVDFYHCPDNTIAMRHYGATELPDGAVWIGELNEKFSLENVTYKANFTQVGEVTYSGNLATMGETSSLLANKNTPTINEFFPVTVDLTLKVTPTDISGTNIVFRNNIEGNNLVLEYNTWHFTDSDNHPNSIDCGTNEELFLAIAALRDDNDYMQFFTNGIIWFLCDAQRVENSNLYDKEYKIQIKKGCDYHKATVEELIEHFKDK